MPLPRPVRPLLPALALVAALAAPAQAAPQSLGAWNRGDQRAVSRAGLLQPVDGGFHGERALTGAQLRPALDAIAQATGGEPIAVPPGRLSLAAFDAVLVRQLGLGDIAAQVRDQARAAGLAPPARFGTEVVARQLGLRTNHPAGHDALEPYPWDAVTRAEAAHSLAVLLGFRGWETGYARDVLSRFQLPRYTDAQRRVLRYAVQFIGMPYVWGGELDAGTAALGGQVRGGYDCSGLVWRVFKLSGFPWGAQIGGRTAAQMAGEFPRSQRIRLPDVRPGDLLFFGPGRFHQKATERRIVHTGIALGNGFMLHSSSQGVAVAPLWEAWRQKEFSWARRLL